MDLLADDIHNTMDLLMHQWMDLNLNLESQKVEENKDSMENHIASKLTELEARENENSLKRKEFEAKEVERQKVLEAKQKSLDERRLEIDSKERDLSIREGEMLFDIQDVTKHETELQMGEKKMKDRAIQSNSAAKLKGVERKRSRGTSELKFSGMEIGEGSRTQPRVPSFSQKSNEPLHASGSLRSVQRNINPVKKGFTFLLNISHTISVQDLMKVPRHFASAFDMSGKKHVILLSNEGSFRLEVKQYGNEVLFRHGWKDFCRLNRLSIGKQCLFRLKEHCVNGDASVFSMDVTTFGG